MAGDLKTLLIASLDRERSVEEINAAILALETQVKPLKLKVEVPPSSFELLNSSLSGTITNLSQAAFSTFGTVMVTALADAGLEMKSLTWLTEKYTSSALGARLATTALTASLSLGLSFAIVGIISGLTHLVNQYKEQQKAQKEFLDSQKQIASQWSTHKERIAALVNERSKLDTTDQRYLEVTNELAELMPSLVDHIDEKGNKHLKSADAIKEELAYAEKLADLQQRQSILDADKDFGKDFKEIKKLQDELDALHAKRNRGGFTTRYSYVKYSDAELNELDIKMEAYEYKLDTFTGTVKEKISTLIQSILDQMDIPVDSGITETLGQITDSLNLGELDPNEVDDLAFKIANLFTSIQQLQTAKSIPEAVSLEQTIYALGHSIGLTDEKIKSYMHTLNQKAAVETQAGSSTVDYAESMDQVNSMLNSTMESISGLSSAYETLSSGEQLSNEAMLNLIGNYPELARYLNQTNDLTFNKGELIKQVAELERKAMLQEVEHHLTSNQALYDSLDAKRQLYEQFYNAIGFSLPYGEEIGLQMFTDEERKQWEELSASMEIWQAQKELLSKPLEFNLRPSSSNGSAPKEEKFEPFVPDVYAKQLTEYEQRLDDLRYKQTLYTEAQQEYTDNLQEQIAVYKQMQDAAKQQNDTLRERKQDIETELRHTKLTKEAQKELQIELEQIDKKLANNSSTWYQHGMTIKGIEGQIKDTAAQLAKLEFDTQREMGDMRTKHTEELADQYIGALKDAIEDQRDLAVEAIQDQIDAEDNRHQDKMDHIDREHARFEQAVNDQLKLLDQTADTEDYNRDLAKRQEEQQELQSRINTLALDDSIEAQAKKKELELELRTLVEETEQFKRERNLQTQKNVLGDLLERKDREVQAEKEAESEAFRIEKETLNAKLKEEEAYWKQTLQNDALFASIRNEILSENLTNLETSLFTFRTGIDTHMTSIGQSIDTNFIAKLNEASGLFNTINERYEQEIAKKMKANSEEWPYASPARQDELEWINEQYGQSIGASKKNGLWYKNGVRLYHNGGTVGGAGQFPLADKLHRLLNLGRDEEISVLKHGEMVLKNPAHLWNRWMKKLPFPILNTASSVGSTQYLIDVRIDRLDGGVQGARDFFQEIRTGLKKHGLK